VRACTEPEHLARAQLVDARLRALDAGSEAGIEYLHDAACARCFADASRRAMAEEVGRMLARRLGVRVCWETAITTDHNHVSLEHYGGRDLRVHRKGAMLARSDESGVLPGSMGTPSFHVEGRGCEEACVRALTAQAVRSAVRQLAAR
jgi:tRNA-splicing ligase RtcB (3'-phosphate/5'-hydroxy nucleic acid ligase)